MGIIKMINHKNCQLKIKQLSNSLGLLILLSNWLIIPVSLAQPPFTFCDGELLLEILNEDNFDNQKLPEGVITDKTISNSGLTVPSLWWAKEQFDPFSGRLINHWIAYQNKKQIDLVINRQLWSFLDYVGRYRLVNQFGTVARDYQYNLRVFTQQNKCLATYTCDYKVAPPVCNINFDPSTQNSLDI